MRRTARRLAEAPSVASFEDLGVQMNRDSTLVSYLHRLLFLLTGNFGKRGAAYIPTALQPSPSPARRRAPSAAARSRARA